MTTDTGVPNITEGAMSGIEHDELPRKSTLAGTLNQPKADQSDLVDQQEVPYQDGPGVKDSLEADEGVETAPDTTWVEGAEDTDNADQPAGPGERPRVLDSDPAYRDQEQAPSTEDTDQDRTENPVRGSFDPGEHTVAEVKAYLADADDEERQRVYDAETQGKGRSSITS